MSPTTHTLQLQPVYFYAIATGAKTVEGRLRTPKYAAIQPGDRIIFRANADPSQPDEEVEELERVVTEVRLFESFQDMLQGCGVEACLPGCPSLEEGVKVYQDIYRDRVNGEQEYGVVGISIAEL